MVTETAFPTGLSGSFRAATWMVTHVSTCTRRAHVSEGKEARTGIRRGTRTVVIGT